MTDIERAVERVTAMTAGLQQMDEVSPFADDISLILDALSQREGEVERLRGALEPFARISPSSLYPDDGSETERYVVRLYDGTRHEPPHDFTGADLAKARAVLQPGKTP